MVVGKCFVAFFEFGEFFYTQQVDVGCMHGCLFVGFDQADGIQAGLPDECFHPVGSFLTFDVSYVDGFYPSRKQLGYLEVNICIFFPTIANQHKGQMRIGLHDFFDLSEFESLEGYGYPAEGDTKISQKQGAFGHIIDLEEGSQDFVKVPRAFGYIKHRILPLWLLGDPAFQGLKKGCCLSYRFPLGCVLHKGQIQHAKSEERADLRLDNGIVYIRNDAKITVERKEQATFGTDFRVGRFVLFEADGIA